MRPGHGGLTYPQRGLSQTLDDGGGWPVGYARVEHRVRVGRGAEAYGRLARGILGWGIQRGAGLTVTGADGGEAGTMAAASMQPGGRVVCGFGLGRLRLPVPCEVVWVEKPAAVVVLPDGQTRPQRCGFGYGTLPGHPASGEEAFIARIEADGSVHFEVLAFSKPSGLIYKLGGPVTALSQRFVTQRYLNAARALAR
ncbi:MAG TPA: DUF1990 domain-containing protein [Micrococcaceae bacterium]